VQLLEATHLPPVAISHLQVLGHILRLVQVTHSLLATVELEHIREVLAIKHNLLHLVLCLLHQRFAAVSVTFTSCYCQFISLVVVTDQ